MIFIYSLGTHRYH